VPQPVGKGFLLLEGIGVHGMMRDRMMDGGFIMWGMGLLGLLFLVVLALGVAALLRSGPFSSAPGA